MAKAESAGGGGKITSIAGTNGNDTLTGGRGTDYMYGYYGADVLRGRAGDDVTRAIRVTTSYMGKTAPTNSSVVTTTTCWTAAQAMTASGPERVRTRFAAVWAPIHSTSVAR